MIRPPLLRGHHLHCEKRTPSAHVAPRRGVATQHAPQAAVVSMVKTALLLLQPRGLDYARLPNVRRRLSPHWQATELRHAENRRVVQVEDVPGRDRAEGRGRVHMAELVKGGGAVAMEAGARTVAGGRRRGWRAWR